MADNAKPKINVDGKYYAIETLTAQAQAQLQNIQFCDQRIQQLQSEWAVADTARLAYTNALKREVQSAKA